MDELTDDPASDDALDGNVVAGILAGVFGVDLTDVRGRCAQCGAVNQVGAMRAYVHAPGTILRCPACAGIVLRVVETVDAVYIDARGVAYLRFDR